MILTAMILGLIAALITAVVLVVVGTIKEGRKQMQQDRWESEKWSKRKQEGYRN